MRTILTKVPDDKAPKELKGFTIIGLALSVTSLLAFWWLGIAGLAFCARGLLLTWHKANYQNSRLLLYRAFAILGILFGLASLAHGLQ